MFVEARPLGGICVSDLCYEREKEYKKFHTRETWRECDCVAKFSESKRAKLTFLTNAGHRMSSRNWRAALIFKNKTKQTEHTTNDVKMSSPEGEFLEVGKVSKT